MDLKKSRVRGCDEKPERRDRLAAAKFFGDPVSSRKLVRAKDTRAGCDRKGEKKISRTKKSLDLFERIYDETPGAREGLEAEIGEADFDYACLVLYDQGEAGGGNREGGPV